jgi:hypothetical protein
MAYTLQKTESEPRLNNDVWHYAHIAQTVEHFLGKEEVTGSSPVMGSTIVLFEYT